MAEWSATILKLTSWSVRYTSVNFGAERSLVSLDWWHQIDWLVSVNLVSPVGESRLVSAPKLTDLYRTLQDVNLRIIGLPGCARAGVFLLVEKSTASERRGGYPKGFKDFYVKAKARICP